MLRALRDRGVESFSYQPSVISQVPDTFALFSKVWQNLTHLTPLDALNTLENLEILALTRLT